MLTGDELLAKVKQMRPDREDATAITRIELDKLWNALEYTLATIGPGGNVKSKENPGWVEIHGGRASQSESFLISAIKMVNQKLKELQ